METLAEKMKEVEFAEEWEKVKEFISINISPIDLRYHLTEDHLRMMAYGFYLVGQRKMLESAKNIITETFENGKK